MSKNEFGVNQNSENQGVVIGEVYSVSYFYFMKKFSKLEHITQESLHILYIYSQKNIENTFWRLASSVLLVGSMIQ
jgi:hypothetical protein